MSESSKDEILDKKDNEPSSNEEKVEKSELTLEEKFKNTEQKLLRHLPTLKIKEEDEKKLRTRLILRL